MLHLQSHPFYSTGGWQMVTMRLLLPKWHWQYLPAIGRNLPANAWDVDTRVQSLGCFPSGIGGIYLHWQESTCQCMRRRHSGSIPGSGRSLEGGNGNSLQYSCLKNPMDRGAWLQPIGSQRVGPKQLSMRADKWPPWGSCIDWLLNIILVPRSVVTGRLPSL